MAGFRGLGKMKHRVSTSQTAEKLLLTAVHSSAHCPVSSVLTVVVLSRYLKVTVFLQGAGRCLEGGTFLTRLVRALLCTGLGCAEA